MPPTVLSTLVRQRPPSRGERAHRRRHAGPRRAAARRLGADSRSSTSTSKRSSKTFHADPVALNGSKLSLAFTDISQNWVKVANATGTVLALSCSETIPLTGPDRHDDAFAMISELSEYLPFKPGKKWGVGGDVDWGGTIYDANTDAQLSLNTVGSDRWRPETLYPDKIDNLFFAGDYCKHDYGITTIEGAVATGVKAAAAVRKTGEETRQPRSSRRRSSCCRPRSSWGCATPGSRPPSRRWDGRG